jgi:hypothetical protein
MANNLINSTIILDKALARLHNKNNFLSNLNHQYDSSFKEYGAAGMPGTSLQIRKPNRYTSRTGLTAAVSGNQESSVTLTVASIRGVDLSFNDVEMRMNVNDFDEQFVAPAVDQLATDLENEIFSGLAKQVYNVVGTVGQIPGKVDSTYGAFQAYGNAKLLLNRGLAPMDNKRCIIVPSALENGALTAFKGLFQDSSEISKQYLDGQMGRHMGFNWYTNELAPAFTNGLIAGTPLVNGGSQSGASLLTKGWTAATTIPAGTVFVISTGTTVAMVHPETRKTYGTTDLTATVAGGTAVGQQFVVTADTVADAGGLATLPISPSIVTSGAYQTVTASPDDGATITMQTGSASTTYPQGLAFHPNFATFVTADLELPKGMDMAGVRRLENISMRFLRGYDILNARRISRLDILYGYQVLRPEWAVRVIGG